MLWRNHSNSLLRPGMSGGLCRGKRRPDAGCPMAGEPRQEQLEDEQALPPAPGETRPAFALGKCSHGQKSRLSVRASYLYDTPFKNRLHLNQKHVFRFVPILSLCFLLPGLLLHQPQWCCQAGRGDPRAPRPSPPLLLNTPRCRGARGQGAAASATAKRLIRHYLERRR